MDLNIGSASPSNDGNSLESDGFWDDDDSEELDDEEEDERILYECLNISYYEYLQSFGGLSGFFCEIDVEFLADRFNQTDLSREFRDFERAFKVILDQYDYCRLCRMMPCESRRRAHQSQENAHESSLSLSSIDSTVSSEFYPLSKGLRRRHFLYHKPLSPELEADAFYLYGALHARFIITSRGLSKMAEKCRRGDFGTCPRVGCFGQPVLPLGTSDRLFQSTVRLYCPRCQDVYRHPLAGNFKFRENRHPLSQVWEKNLLDHPLLDGAFFGTSFAHMILQQFVELRPQPVFGDLAPTLANLAAARLILISLFASAPVGTNLKLADDELIASDDSEKSIASTLGDVPVTSHSINIAKDVEQAVAVVKGKLEEFFPDLTGSAHVQDTLSTGSKSSSDSLAATPSLLERKRQFLLKFINSRHVPKLFGFNVCHARKTLQAQDSLLSKVASKSCTP